MIHRNVLDVAVCTIKIVGQKQTVFLAILVGELFLFQRLPRYANLDNYKLSPDRIEQHLIYLNRIQ